MRKHKIYITIISLIIICIVTYLTIFSNNKYSYDKPYIPKGFNILESDINKGFVIKDKSGNEFVWIPVDGKEVTLSRKTFVDKIKNISNNDPIDRTYFGEEVLKSITHKYKDDEELYKYDIDYFKESVKKYGGFYISRYEIGDSSSSSFREDDKKGEVFSKKGLIPYNYVSRDEALELSIDMYKSNKNIVSNLVNSYAWDIVLEYISINNKDYVFEKEKNYKKEISKTGETDDVINNIYDLRGNMYEWTTEYSAISAYEYYANCVYRGESYKSNMLSPSIRYYNDNIKNKYIGFRVILYF